MELFEKIVNSLKPLTIFGKRFMEIFGRTRNKALKTVFLILLKKHCSGHIVNSCFGPTLRKICQNTDFFLQNFLSEKTCILTYLTQCEVQKIAKSYNQSLYILIIISPNQRKKWCINTMGC